VVEAAGVELFSVLTARKLLILRMARGGKKGTIADSIVRLLYENLFAFRRVSSLPPAEYPTILSARETKCAPIPR